MDSTPLRIQMSISAGSQNFELDVRVLDNTASDLVGIARQYWDLRGLDEAGVNPLWRTRVREIDTNDKGGRHHLLAAAASRAVAKGYFCASCEEELSLPNRTALNQILSGDDSVVCVDCHPTLMEEAEQYRNPDTWVARQAERRREKQSINEAYAEAEEFWIRSHREVLQRTYALLCQPEDQLPQLSVRQELAALAVVRNAAKGGIISLKEHLTLPPLSPDNRDVETLAELRAHEVLCIHPPTPMESMCWRIGSFSEAVAHDEGDLGSLPAPELTGSYFPYRTRFYVSYGRDLQGAVSLADTELLRRLTHALNDYERFAALERLLAEVIAEEGVRYFDHKLMEHHLPAVPEERRPRLREAAERVAQVRCLGQLYFAAWAATRDAAAAARRHPRSPLASMTEQSSGLRARRSIDLHVFRLDVKEVEKALEAAVARAVNVRALIAHTHSGPDKRLRQLELRMLEKGVAVSRSGGDLVRYHGKLIILVREELHVYGFNFTALDIDKIFRAERAGDRVGERVAPAGGAVEIHRRHHVAA